MENVSKSSIFFMVTAEDRDEAVEFCQKNELCDPLHQVQTKRCFMTRFMIHLKETWLLF